MAWIVRDYYNYDDPFLQVRTASAILAEGRDIRRRSLRLDGDTLTWVQGGVQRQARIDSPRIARAMTRRWISEVPS